MWRSVNAPPLRSGRQCPDSRTTRTAPPWAVKAYKVGYSRMKPADDGSYMVNHTALIYLMAPAGAYITHFPFRIAPDKLAASLGKWVEPSS